MSDVNATGKHVIEDLFSLSGKTALVTGGAQGLGRMIAEGLLRAGAAVSITSRKAEACEQAAREMSALGECMPLPADLSTAAGAKALAEAYRSSHDRLDILVNNAGKTWGASLETFPEQAWPSVMAVNVQVPFTLVQELLGNLERAGSTDNPARVINIGSVAGLHVERLQAYSYSASKAALHMLTRDLAAELAHRNVNVNAIVPGFFPTKMTAHLREDDVVDPELLRHVPLRRLGRTDEIAGAVIYLASRAGAYVTGALLPVDGGVTGCA